MDDWGAIREALADGKKRDVLVKFVLSAGAIPTSETLLSVQPPCSAGRVTF